MNPRKLFRRIFKRKAKLPRGLPLKKIDPHARHMVKQADRYSADHSKIANRLKGQDRRRNLLPFLDAMAVSLVILGLTVNVVHGYIYYAPVSLIAKASPEKAKWLDNLRISGCADSYARYTLLSPIVDGLSEHLLKSQYLDCAKARMDFPA